jgi:hypothetical protein
LAIRFAAPVVLAPLVDENCFSETFSAGLLSYVLEAATRHVIERGSWPRRSFRLDTGGREVARRGRLAVQDYRHTTGNSIYVAYFEDR